MKLLTLTINSVSSSTVKIQCSYIDSPTWYCF